MKITDIKQQVKRPDRYSIYIDGKFAFGLSENGLLQSGLSLGQEIDAQKRKALEKTAETDKAFGNALRYVAMRQRSEWELATYLRRKQVDEPVAQAIIERLRGLDLLGDKKFAEAWVANRRLLRSVSKRKLQQELKQKRVPDNIIQTVLLEDSTSDDLVIKDLIVKKRHRYPDDTKFMQYLARQGFSYDAIKNALQVMDDF